MLQPLHAAWRARRVLLAGEADRSTLYMQSLLGELGARPVRIPLTADNETLSRALTDGRISCIIVPCMRALSGSLSEQLHVLDVLLVEAREAGVPLVMLLSDESVYRTAQHPWYVCEDDPIGGETCEGLFQSILQLFADGVNRGLLGDAVNVQCVRHLPCLGCGHPAVAPYEDWCRALSEGQKLCVPHPSAQGVFLHPLDVCLGSLLLGARFFLGDTACTGVFNLGAGPQNLVPNRTAALRLSRSCSHARPILEAEPPGAIYLPLPDGSRARLLCGAGAMISGEEALKQLLELDRAARESFDTQMQVIQEQTRRYLTSLCT